MRINKNRSSTENQISPRFWPIFDFELKWKRSRAELKILQLRSDSSLVVGLLLVIGVFIILVYMTVVVLWTTQDISKGLALLQIQDIDFPYEFRIFILVHWISGILDLETSSVFNSIKNKCFMCNSNSRSLASNPRTLPWEFLEIIGFSR